MRDLVVREALATMAHDAAKRLRELIAAGDEIPYEVREPGDGSPLCEYQPLTEVFVRGHAGALRELDAFGSACAALEASDLAGPYLEQMGVGVPEEPGRRAELAAVVFLCRMWGGSADLSLDADRIEAAVTEVESGGEVDEGEVEVVVPLRGLQLPVARLELSMATIVRADAVDVPAEARAGDGLGASPWEPAFLAVARLPLPEHEEDEDDDPAPTASAVAAFHRLITTLRLFKAGGVALAPHAWTRLPGDRWRRIATGAGKPRPGGYRVADTEVAELAAFASALTDPSTPFGRSRDGRPGLPAALGRALSRFEAGLERNVVIEALNDYLLALRFVLEGGGPADLGLSMRVAALCAEPERRDEVKAIVDRAAGLERELWSGEPAPGAATATPAETATELEEMARAILKDAACGHLGSDLRSTADEILLADGLAVGEGAGEHRGGTEEWVLDDEPGVVEDGDDADGDGTGELDLPEPEASDLDEEMEPERRISIRRVFEPEEETVRRSEAKPSRAAVEAPMVTARAAQTQADAEWQDEGRAEGAALPSPVVRLIEQTRAERRAHHDRVANLFPRPETTEWNVREIAYDRRRRAEVS